MDSYNITRYLEKNMQFGDGGVYGFSDTINVINKKSEKDIEVYGECNFQNIIELDYDVDSENVLTTRSSESLSVTRYQQVETNWCWAACAQMIGKYMTGTAKSQTSIVKAIKGYVVNDSAADWELKKAIDYALGSSSYYSTNQGVLSFSTLYTSIYTNGRPCAIRMKWSATTGHYLVVSGARNSNQTLRLIDPWPSTPTNWYKYSALVSGTTIGTGTGTYARTFRIVK